jgi:glycosyltransferase involved in cell wall biosynthesis
MIKLSILIPVWNQEELVIKALDCLPRRDDIEVLVRDDGSTDNTLANLKRYKEEHPELNLTVVANKGNKGVAWTKNRLLKAAKGEWFHVHDSDDWVYTNLYDKMITEWLANCKDADVVCMDLEINGGVRYPLNENTQRVYCAQISRFIKRDFVKGMTFPENIRAGDDWYFAEELLTRNPKIVYSGVMAYHYNFPREGSLSYLQLRGLI